MLSISSQAIAAAAGVSSLVLVWRSQGAFGASVGASDPLAVAGIMIWLLSPYVMLMMLAQRAVRLQGGGAVVLIGTMLIGGFGIFILLEPTSRAILNFDLKGDVVVVVLPALQWAALGLVGAAHLFASRSESANLAGDTSP